MQIIQEIPHHQITVGGVSVPEAFGYDPTPTHKNRLRPKVKEEHADNGGTGINNKIREVRGLWVGVGLQLPFGS